VLLVALLAASRGGQAAGDDGIAGTPARSCDVAEHGDELTPLWNWRLVPLAATSDPDSGLFEALQAQRDGRIEAWAKAVRIAVQLPPAESGALFTFEPAAPSWRYRAEVSEDSTDGADGTWVQCAAGEHVRQRGYRLWKVELPASPKQRWLRIAISAEESLAVGSIGLYSLDPEGRNDYWVVLGASIQAQSIRNDVFKQMVAERYGYDPVIFNTGVGGWQTKDVRDALPRILSEHPHARFVVIHIGGNNVSLNRPYPGGEREIRDDLVAILDGIVAAGRVPILSRLSYRAYKWDPPVPPEENGSGPYVTAIYDPLIQEYCPLFFDEEAGRGIVDAYGWFKSHPQELAGDGIHVNEAGEMSWNRLWAEQAGKIVYAASEDPMGSASEGAQSEEEVRSMLRLESDVLRVEIDATTGRWALIDRRSGQRWPSEGAASSGEAGDVTSL
jgi:lysophospholipase L1-like esterase